MRWTLVPAGVAVVMALAAIWLHGRDLSWHVFSSEAGAAAAEMKKAFQARYPAERTFNLADVPQGESGNELLDPATALPQSHLYDADELKALLHFSRTCEPAEHKSDGPLQKAWTWHEHLCTKKPLPDAFFSTSPRMHPLGQSYALLAHDAGEGLRTGDVHALELGGLDESALSPPLRVLASLTSSQIGAVAASHPLVTSAKYVLIRRTGAQEGERAATYDVHSRADWDAFVPAFDLVATEKRKGALCLFTEGNICWQPNAPRIALRTRAAVGLGIGSVVILLVTLAWLAIRRSALLARQRADRMLVLQTLTHELRTPATSLQLSLENFRGGFDALGEEQQTEFLRMCDEVQRLNRVIAGSAQYLGGAAVRKESIPSVTTWLRQVLASYEERVTLQLPERDVPFVMDAYWLGLCVKNLVENALAHGKAPVRVKLDLLDRTFSLHVIDDGDGPKESLEQLKQAFYKSPQSRGLGLGLSIVSTVVENMGGRLELGRQPTTFSIHLTEAP